MNRTVVTLLIISLVVTPSYAESNKKAKQFFTALANAISSRSLENEHSRFEKQRQRLEKDYQSGKISTEGYYNALAHIDKNQLEWEKAVSQTAIQVQQTKIQQQRAAVEAQKARQGNMQIMRVGGSGSTKTITNWSGKVVGYVDE